MKNKIRLFKNIFIGFSLLFLLFSSFLSFFPIISKSEFNLRLSSTDLYYDFQDNLRIESYTPNISSYTNLYNDTGWHTSIFSDNYSASYDFLNETVGTSGLSIGYIDNIDDIANLDAIILSNVSGHNHVLNCYHTLSNREHENDFPDQVSGLIELWLYIHTDDTVKLRLCESDVASDRLELSFTSGGVIQYYDGSWHNIGSWSTLRWYHLRIDFDSTDDWHFWLNGVSVDGGSGYGYYGVIVDMDSLFFQAGATANYSLDAIGFDWFNYSERGNIIPNEISFVSDLQTESYSFNFAPDGNPTTDGSSIYNCNWTEVDPSDYIYNYMDGSNGFITFEGSTNEISFYKTGINISIDFNVIEFREITYGFNDGSFRKVEIHSIDNTKIIELRCLDSGSARKLQFYNGSDYVEIDNDFPKANPDGRWTLWQLIIMDDLVFIRIVCEAYAPVYRYYMIPKININKAGINKINYTLQMSDSSPVIRNYIEYVEVWNNGYSVSDDYYSASYKLYINATDQYLYKHEHNFLNYNISGIGSFSLVDEYMNDVFLIDSYGNFTENIETDNFLPYSFNLGSGTINERIKQPTVMISSNESIIPTINYLKSFGISLDYNGTSEITPYYTYSNNINHSNTYFYQNNRLNYYLESENSSLLEYIQVEFDITNLETVNYTCAISHRKSTTQMYSEFRVYYIDSSYTPYESTTSYLADNKILPQTKIIDKFTFLITDNNETHVGVMSGYFSNIDLIYTPNISVIITTTSFFGIIPIILMVIVVPFMFSKKTRLDFLFIPLVMLMAIISMSTSLIPYWLGTIIIIFCIAYYLLKSKYSA